MPRLKSLKPSYCRDRNSAFVTIDGKKIGLGRFGTPESRDKYDLTIAEWIAKGRPRGVAGAEPAKTTVNQVIAGFWAHARKTYPAPPFHEGKRPAGELGNYWDALRLLRRLYGPTLAEEFGPLKLAAVREAMIHPRKVTDPATGAVTEHPGWCLNVANRQTGRLKHVFKWAVANELIPGAVHSALTALSGLRSGRSEARETEPVKPAPDAYVQAVLPYLGRQVRAMMGAQLLTGMRPGEVCQIRTADVDTAGEVWIYRPRQHKTKHRGGVREIRIGPKAQDLLRPFLGTDLQAFIFSPAQAEAERHAEQRNARKTPLTPSQRLRAEKAAQRPRQRPPKDCYTTKAYRRAIVRACGKADAAARKAGDAGGVAQWTPNQLRHNAATLLNRLYGIETARVVLGHASSATTAIYAEMDGSKAGKAMSEVG